MAGLLAPRRFEQVLGSIQFDGCCTFREVEHEGRRCYEVLVLSHCPRCIAWLNVMALRTDRTLVVRLHEGGEILSGPAVARA
jgi:hypothetical protein